MKKLICLTLLLTIVSPGFAQQALESAALESLVNTERAFAGASEEKGTREAFMAFIADDGILFRPTAVRGKPAMKPRIPGPSGRPMESGSSSALSATVGGRPGECRLPVDRLRRSWMGSSAVTGSASPPETARGSSPGSMVAASLIDFERRTVVWEERLRGDSLSLPMFSPDGRFISLPRQESRERHAIWLYEAATGKSRVAVRFPEPFQILFRACWVDDGGALVVNRRQTISHIVLFDRFWVKESTP